MEDNLREREIIIHDKYLIRSGYDIVLIPYGTSFAILWKIGEYVFLNDRLHLGQSFNQSVSPIISQKQRKKMRPYIPRYFEILIEIRRDEATRLLDVVSNFPRIPPTSSLGIRGSETKQKDTTWGVGCLIAFRTMLETTKKKKANVRVQR
jgi:hypothetical protein